MLTGKVGDTSDKVEVVRYKILAIVIASLLLGSKRAKDAQESLSEVLKYVRIKPTHRGHRVGIALNLSRPMRERLHLLEVKMNFGTVANLRRRVVKVPKTPLGSRFLDVCCSRATA